jgi:hypothetical protein
MREAPNATLKTQQVLLTGGTWTKVLNTNVQRTYLVIQNHHDAHEIEVGFSTDTTPPTSATGFKIEGAVTGNKIGDTTFQFAVAPINAVWARANDAHDHPIDIMYDD